MTDQVKYIRSKVEAGERAIEAVLKLHEEGASLAFIARYRKDQTGNLDELVIAEIIRQGEEYTEFEKRRNFIIENIREQNKLSSELEQKLLACRDPEQLEDLYLPYKQRRKTRADMARENGLEPMAKLILSQRERDLEYPARRYINDKVNKVDDVISGASDIVAQWIADDAETRQMLRLRFEQHALIETKPVKGKEKEGEKYKDYFNYSEKAGRAAAHRVMAIMRAENEGFLRVSVEPDELITMEAIDRKWIKRDSACRDLMMDIVKDAYKRLIAPSLENELKQKMFEKAETEAIRVFAVNLSQLLLSAPFGSKRVIAIDPGIRTGCKTVCLDEHGKLLHHTVLFFQSENEKQRSLEELKRLAAKYKAEAFAVGNGTAGRETGDAIRSVFREIPLFMVNEDGASVYSVSEIARKEFPDQDVTVKGAVSIGRRLMDPLAELVKIDAKSIGVGQYQHDVNQNKLKKVLNETVESCVNKVGVDLNTAGEELLKHVSGLGPVLASNIVAYREKNGEFKSRAELKKVSRLGDKAFEQAAGFLRVRNAKDPLDNSAVHPEQYDTVKKIAALAGKPVQSIIGNSEVLRNISGLEVLREQTGAYTFDDLIKELEKPGLDPREPLGEEQFDHSVRSMADLKPGMIVKGVVSNITAFGAFIDLGIKENGLLHISEISDTYIKDPNEVLKLNQQLSLKVKEIDTARKRISLTLKK